MDLAQRMRLLFCLCFALAVAAVVVRAQEAAPASASPRPPARVYFYLAKARAIRANPISCDGVEVARLRHRWTYFALQIAEGERSFRGRHDHNQVILNLVSGQ